MKDAKPPSIERFPSAKQKQLDLLLEKNSEGTITPAEKVKLVVLVAEAEQLMLANAQRLAEFVRHEAPLAPKDGVPVTVWVQPQPAGT